MSALGAAFKGLTSWSPIYKALDRNPVGTPDSRKADAVYRDQQNALASVGARRRGPGATMLSDDPLNINNRPGYTTLR